MNAVDNIQQEASSFAHVGRIWREESYQIIVFIAVQVLVGQAGLFLILFLGYQSVSDLSAVWDSYLRSGGSYIFAIALLSSACAAVACEFIEAVRDKSAVLMWRKKVTWIVAAVPLICLQAGLVGPLLAPPAEPSIESRAAVEPHSATISPPIESLTKKPPIRHSLQIVFWLLSILLAFQLFCLGRAKYLHDRYAKKRSEDVHALSAKAENRTTTFDGEKV